MRLSCLALALCVFAAQGQQPSQGRIADFDVVANRIPKLHPGFFAHLDRAEFQRAADDLSGRMPALSDAEFAAGLARLLAMAGDAHTSLDLGVGPAFPLQFRWLTDGIFVTGAGLAYPEAVGAQLIGIAGLPIDEVVGRMRPVISHENEYGMRAFAEPLLRFRRVLEGVGVLDPAAPTAAFTLRTLAGREFTLQVAADDAPMAVAPDAYRGPLPAVLQSGQFYWSAYSSATRLLYFKYNNCRNSPANPFPSFAAALLRTLDTSPVDAFVIDFRGNPGGENMIIQPLLDGLQQRLPRLAANSGFRMYVAFDKRSFSAAVDNAMKLMSPSLARGVIRTIGEPAGQAPTMYGNTVPFLLSGLNMSGHYATRYFPQPSWIPDGPALVPDIAGGATGRDYFARFDPVMAAILARSEGAPPRPSGDAIAVNGATFRPEHGLAPGSFAAVFGAFPAPDEVLVSGIRARIVSAAAGQVNVIVPETVPPGRAAVAVRAAGRDLASGEATITDTGPGIFVLRPGDPAQPGAVLNEDGAVNGESNPALRGSVIQIFATGTGSAPQVYIGEAPAEILFHGVVAPGLWQINARLPEGLLGQVPVFVVARTLASNGVTISVR